jgi:hypothetical protein
METKIKSWTGFGTSFLVQFRVEQSSVFTFKPGAPAIQAGGLIISEARSNGIVGELIAVNNTADFLLLTDADVLTGAKQNRVLNQSVLLAPYSKSVLDVSCVERRRWHYTSEHFSSPAMVADNDLRKTKAISCASKAAHHAGIHSVQHEVWDHIAHSLKEEKVVSETENYRDLMNHRAKYKPESFPVCEPAEECNGLALLIGRKIAALDIFGDESVYRYYFPKLRDAAFLRNHAFGDKPLIDHHEAGYRVTDLLDRFIETVPLQGQQASGAGFITTRETTGWVGFQLDYTGHLIHCSLFEK